MKVIKRDGRKVEFQISKIHKAVDKAFIATRKTAAPKEYHETLVEAFEILRQFKLSTGTIVFNIEEIQDIIERSLMKNGYYDVAKSYILYREEHKGIRIIRERIEYMDKYSKSRDNAATSSETDANANVGTKNVANLDGEVYKTLNRQIQRTRMRKKLKELFPEVEQQYVLDLEHHIIYAHDEASAPTVKNYCEAVSLYPFVQEGTSGMDGLKTSAPKNLNSFCGQFCNLVFLLSAQCKGAVAFGEFFNVFDYYCTKDFGPDYHKNLDETVSLMPKRTVLDTIHQAFQQITYSINQPAGNRCYQSPFTNISYYDRNYWKALFEEVAWPDGTKPEWERVSFLQKEYMQWFNRERTRTLLTFPVETMALLTNGKDVLDKEYKEFTAEMYAKGHSFFTFLSDSPNALASCCRLRNEIKENVFSFTNGLTGVQTGSANVITLNLSRITGQSVESSPLYPA